MAKSKQEGSAEESQDPTTVTLQAAVVPVKISEKSPDPPSDTPIQTLPDTSGISESTALVATELSLDNQAQNQSTVIAVIDEPVVPQAPVVSLIQTATDMSFTSVEAPKTSSLPGVPSQSAQELSGTQKDTQSAVVPIQRDALAQPNELASEQITYKPANPQAVLPHDASAQLKETDATQVQPVVSKAEKSSVTPEPPQPAAAKAPPLPGTSESKSTLDIQSMPQKTSQRIESRQAPPLPGTSESKSTLDIQSLPQKNSQGKESKTESHNMFPAQQKPHTMPPQPNQATHPIQQAVSVKLGASHEQPVKAKLPDTPETKGELRPIHSTIQSSPLSETEAAQASTQTSLHRTLDPATTSVARQIQDSMAQGIQQDSRQIVIRLDPPELGRVAIRFEEGDQGITGVLEVQRSQTRHEIQQALPEIIQHLQNGGVQVKRIEVIRSADADPDTFQDQAFSQAQDQNLEQQTPGNSMAHRGPSFRWPSSSDGGIPQSRREQYVSDRGINMLI